MEYLYIALAQCAIMLELSDQVFGGALIYVQCPYYRPCNHPSA